MSISISNLAKVEIINNMITNNKNGISVGGPNASGELLITGNTILDNVGGGGLTITGLSGSPAPLVAVTDNLIKNNGGGISVSGTSTLTVSKNQIIANSGDTYGGAWIQNTTSYITDNIFARNTSAASYGGLYLNPTSSLYFTNNTVTNNTAQSIVGGIYCSIDGSNIADIYNNIIWDNKRAGTSSDLYLAGTGIKRGYYNNYQTIGGLWSFEDNRLNVDPLFSSASTDDYHLGTGSLCLNAGDNSAPGIPAKDLDNNTRICDSVVDLGAYEHCTGDCHPADVNNDWVITLDEVTNYAASWKAGASWPKAPNPIHIDYVTRCGYLQKLHAGKYENKGGGKPLCWETKP